MAIQTVLNETRRFAPPMEFLKAANLSANEIAALRERAQRDPVSFWEAQARERVLWTQPWEKAFNWDLPNASWFQGGMLNACVNCVDRHLQHFGSKTALLWEGEDGSTERVTYSDLSSRINRLAHVLEQDFNVRAGDTVAIYMPLVPEAIVAMLACARIGAPHTVIFAGFAAQAIRDRVRDAGCKVILTADFTLRRGQRLGLIETVREAVKQVPEIEHVLVLRRDLSTDLSSVGKAQWVDWKSAVSKKSTEHTASSFDSEHRLFLLYTSGTTGKPKGIVHTTGGYLTQTLATASWVFDLKSTDIYWCTADIGWITGHSYLVYGLLGNAATCVLFEGAMNFPTSERIWSVIDRYRVSILYTAPTAIRALMRGGEEPVLKHSLQSLRLLGSVGEPINPEAWIWYHTVVGKERCPIVDTWWQTETGGMMISPIPSEVAAKPGSATRFLPGLGGAIVDENGKAVPHGEGGYLVLKAPWPSMLRGIHGDPLRFQETYWSKLPGWYFTGDGANQDADGYFWIKGRVDDVLNVSGHRLGTMEIESALVSHPSISEAAVVGRKDDLKGQAVVAFVVPKDEQAAGSAPVGSDIATRNLKAHVAGEIGAIARPDEIYWTRQLPKTRSGKIMRRFLRDLAEGREATGDTTTLENPGLIEWIGANPLEKQKT